MCTESKGSNPAGEFRSKVTVTEMDSVSITETSDQIDHSSGGPGCGQSAGSGLDTCFRPMSTEPALSPWIHDIITETDVERGCSMTTTGDHVWEAGNLTCRGRYQCGTQVVSRVFLFSVRRAVEELDLPTPSTPCLRSHRFTIEIGLHSCPTCTARHLVAFCESEADSIGLRRHGATVLELGAGCGHLGMTLARNLPNLGTCLLTEMETGGALEHLRHNTTLNEAVLHGRAKVGPCDWLACCSSAQASGKAAVHADPVLGKHWDIVIGSDLVYDEAGVKMLPHVFNQLVTPSNTAFYCHTLHRYDMMDADFLHALKEHGLNVEEVRRRGEVTPPPSPPPFECLFNEHRLVIWKLTRPQ